MLTHELSGFAVICIASCVLGQLGPDADLSSFNSIDTNDDGKISQKELTNLALPQCLKDLILQSFSDINVDVDDDDLLSELEWYNFVASRLGRLITCGEVANWITYAVQKPQYADVFRENFVTGHDFVDLVRDNGALLLKELQIRNVTARNQIRRHMILKLCSDAAEPNTPTNLSVRQGANAAIVSWDPVKADPPVVSYQLQRAFGEGTFVDVPFHYELETEFVDTTVEEATYQYRIQAWTILGRSGWCDPVTYTHKHTHPRLSLVGPNPAPAVSTATATAGQPHKAPYDHFLVTFTILCIVLGGLGKYIFPAPAATQHSSSGSSEASEDKASTSNTGKPKPSPPYNIQAISRDEEILVQWSMTRDYPVSHFTILCKSQTGELRTIRVLQDCNEYTIVSLQNGILYEIRIVAHIGGNELESRPVCQIPLPSQRRNVAGYCNWCRKKPDWAPLHTCKTCGATFCAQHGQKHWHTPFSLCDECECKYCILKKVNLGEKAI